MTLQLYVAPSFYAPLDPVCIQKDMLITLMEELFRKKTKTDLDIAYFNRIIPLLLEDATRDDNFECACNTDFRNRYYSLTHFIIRTEFDFDMIAYFIEKQDDEFIENLQNPNDFIVPCLRCSFFDYEHVRCYVFHMMMQKYDEVFWTHNGPTFYKRLYSKSDLSRWAILTIWHLDYNVLANYISFIPEEVLLEIILLLDSNLFFTSPPLMFVYARNFNFARYELGLGGLSYAI